MTTNPARHELRTSPEPLGQTSASHGNDGMPATSNRGPSRRDWLVPAGLIGLSFVPVAAGLVRVVQLASNPAVTETNARFVNAPVPIALHLVSVIVFSVAGAFQFSKGLRKRRRQWHRRAGRVLIPSGLIAAATGLWLSVLSDLPAHDNALLMVFRVGFGVTMACCLLAGTHTLRKHRYIQHGAWMRRSYAIGLGAGTQAFTVITATLLIGPSTGQLRAWSMFAGWAINLAVAERYNHLARNPTPKRLATESIPAPAA